MGSPAAGRFILIRQCGLGVPGSRVSMCMYVHVCAVHMQPLAPPVCVCAIPVPPPAPFSQGEGTEGNRGEHGREGTGGANPDPQEGPGGPRGHAPLASHPDPRPQSRRSCCHGNRRSPEHPRVLPAPPAAPALLGTGLSPKEGEVQGLPTPQRRPKCAGCTPSPARGSSVPVWRSLQLPAIGLSLLRGTAGSRGDHGAATVRAHRPLPLAP